jgi:hypothetical protein
VKLRALAYAIAWLQLMIAAMFVLPPQRIVISGDDPALLPILAPLRMPPMVPAGYVPMSSGGQCMTAIPVPGSTTGAMMVVGAPCSATGVR